MSEMTPRAILEKHTWEGSLWIADDLRPAQAVAKDLYAALAQEIADHEVDRARIEALEKWGEDAETALVYASNILGGCAKDGNPAEIAEGECDRVFAHWVTRRTGGDTMSSQGNLEWYDKNVKTPWVLELEARIEALERELGAFVALFDPDRKNLVTAFVRATALAAKEKDHG